MLTRLQRAILFPRAFVATDPREGAGIDSLERIWLDVDGGRVEAWYRKSRVGGQERSGAVIFAHGNGEAIDQWGEPLSPYLDMGLGVLIPEYRGYGRSGGEPSQAAITEDFVRFHDLLATRSEIDPDRILFHGRSLGGGVAGALAAERAPRALILESTFTSVASMASSYFVPRSFVPDPFDTERTLEALERPVLIIHGTNDKVVPYRHAQALLAKAKQGRLVTYACGHNDLPPDRAHYWDEIRKFVGDHVLA